MEFDLESLYKEIETAKPGDIPSFDMSQFIRHYELPISMERVRAKIKELLKSKEQ